MEHAIPSDEARLPQLDRMLRSWKIERALEIAIVAATLFSMALCWGVAMLAAPVEAVALLLRITPGSTSDRDLAEGLLAVLATVGIASLLLSHVHRFLAEAFDKAHGKINDAANEIRQLHQDIDQRGDERRALNEARVISRGVRRGGARARPSRI